MNRAAHLFLIVNPVAGNVEVERVYETFEKIYQSAGVRYVIYETTGQESLKSIVTQAQSESYTMIVAVGGDGTVSEMVDGLVGSQIPLGIIPLGTANVVARELGIPLDLEEACKLLLGGQQIKQLDVMQVGTRSFISHISLGVYSRIIKQTSVENKRRFGTLAYLWSAMKEISREQSWKFTINVDGQTEKVRASLIMVANAGAFGIGELHWGAHISPNDGQIDLCIMQGKSIRDYLSFFWYTLRGQPKQIGKMSYLACKQEVIIRTNKRVPVRADGEIIGQSKVSIKVRPQAVPVIVPAS